MKRINALATAAGASVAASVRPAATQTTHTVTGFFKEVGALDMRFVVHANAVLGARR